MYTRSSFVFPTPEPFLNKTLGERERQKKKVMIFFFCEQERKKLSLSYIQYRTHIKCTQRSIASIILKATCNQWIFPGAYKKWWRHPASRILSLTFFLNPFFCFYCGFLFLFFVSLLNRLFKNPFYMSFNTRSIADHRVKSNCSPRATRGGCSGSVIKIIYISRLLEEGG